MYAFNPDVSRPHLIRDASFLIARDRNGPPRSLLRMPITGHNGKALTAQIQNVAAAHILIGEWTDDAVHTHGGRLAKRLSFWLEREPNQRSFWTPTMTLSDEFFEAIQQASRTDRHEPSSPIRPVTSADGPVRLAFLPYAP